MPLRIYVTSTIPDARARAKKTYLNSLGLKAKVAAVRVVDCYTIDTKLESKQIIKTCQLLANPLAQIAGRSPLAPKKFSFALEIGFLPGVTDNLGNTAKETLSDGAKIIFRPGQNVYSSQVLFISGLISSNEIKKIASSLYNPLIQRADIKSFGAFQKNGLNIILPKVNLRASNKVAKIDLNISDEKLKSLGKLGIPTPLGHQGPLALSLYELKTIRNYFNSQNRPPTDIELECLAQTWSEHCKHTIFADPIDEIKDGIFKHYIKRATEIIRKQKGKKDFCVSVFTDNSGGIAFDSKWILSHKVETHNTPSALDPFGGAITGIVGVNRDALGFGLGSKPIANTYGFCLADPSDKTKLFRDKELKSPMLSARRIMDGVIAGVNAGGNQSGIPTPLGFLYFDPRYRGKPLVFAGTMGLLPKKIKAKQGHIKQAQSGDYIVMLGGRVGADGIHGATFSSEGLDTHSPAAAVQIGDPITQKKFSDAIAKEARDQNLYNSITDCGAGGLSSAVGEMAKECGGCEIWLDKVPLKYPGLAPWQIWISESQERMILSVPKNKWEKFQKLMSARGIEATMIGKFIANGQCVVKYSDKTLLNITMDFLHNGRPKKHLKTKNSQLQTRKLQLPNKKDYSAQLLNLLGRLNITSTEFVSTQYDHEVQGSSVLKPLQGRGRVNSEAAVIRPVLTSKKGAVLAYGLQPQLTEIDPYKMAAASIDSAIAAAVAAGANVDYLALLDNFCWCSPEDPKRLWQLKQAAKACFDYATAFNTPFISGKDSMHNDFKGFGANAKALKISIPPTLLISALGVIPNLTKAVSLDAKMNDDLIYILGNTNNEMAGAEFVQLLKQKGGQVPTVNAEKNLKLYRAFYQATQNNLIASAVSLNRGGLAVALCKSLIAGGLGAKINLATLPGPWEENYQALFSESQGRILVTVDPKKSESFEKAMQGNIFAKIGQITKQPILEITDKALKPIIKLKINQALKSYKATFKDF